MSFSDCSGLTLQNRCKEHPRLDTVCNPCAYTVARGELVSQSNSRGGASMCQLMRP